MKVYAVFPLFDRVDATIDKDDPRIRSGWELVAKIVFDALRQGGDRFHYAFDWRDPGREPWQAFNGDLAQPHLVDLSDPETLHSVIRMTLEPSGSGSVSIIRSMATCRAATFGYDGQAFLCLRHEDEAPSSPDESLVVIEERPDILMNYDYFDGWVPDRTKTD